MYRVSEDNPTTEKKKQAKSEVMYRINEDNPTTEKKKLVKSVVMYRATKPNPTTEKKKQAQFDVSYRRRGKKQIKIRKIIFIFASYCINSDKLFHTISKISRQ